jgi:hypothetical protein
MNKRVVVQPVGLRRQRREVGALRRAAEAAKRAAARASRSMRKGTMAAKSSQAASSLRRAPGRRRSSQPCCLQLVQVDQQHVAGEGRLLM